MRLGAKANSQKVLRLSIIEDLAIRELEVTENGNRVGGDLKETGYFDLAAFVRAEKCSVVPGRKLMVPIERRKRRLAQRRLEYLREQRGNVRLPVQPQNRFGSNWPGPSPPRLIVSPRSARSWAQSVA